MNGGARNDHDTGRLSYSLAKSHDPLRGKVKTRLRVGSDLKSATDFILFVHDPNHHFELPTVGYKPFKLALKPVPILWIQMLE